MKNLTIEFSSFKRLLQNCPDIKVMDCKSQFDPPSESRRRGGMAELREAGFDVEDWLGQIITLTKGNSISYHVIRNRQGRGEGSFNLIDPQEFLLESEPWVAKQGATPEDRSLLAKVRVIDQPNVAQTFTAVVVGSSSPPKLPNSLVYCRRGRVLPLGIGFKDYYEHLAAFMGILNWQLLFSEASTQDGTFQADFEQLKENFEDFKAMFPGRDFSLWQNKLAEKGLN